MQLNIKAIQIASNNNNGEICSYLKSYGFESRTGLDIGNNYKYIVVFLDEKNFGANYDLTTDCVWPVFNFDFAKIFIASNFQKVLEINVGAKYYWKDGTFVVPIYDYLSKKYVLGGCTGNPFCLYAIQPMTYDECIERLRCYCLKD